MSVMENSKLMRRLRLQRERQRDRARETKNCEMSLVGLP